MNEKQILKTSLNQFFSKEILKFTLAPIIITIISTLLLYNFFSSLDIDGFQDVNINIEKHEKFIQDGRVVENHYTQQYTDNSAKDFLKNQIEGSEAYKYISAALSFLIVGVSSIFIAVVTTGFIAPQIIKTLDNNKEDTKEINYNIVKYIIEVVKNFIISIILFAVLFLSYFIPFINIITFNLPFYYFFHKTLNYQVNNCLFTKKEYFEIYFINKSNIRIKTSILYIISLIPFVAVFLSVFYVVYLKNSYEELKGIENCEK